MKNNVIIPVIMFLIISRINAQNIGINVPNPAWPLDISSGQGVIRLQSTTAPYGSVLELKNNYASSEYLGAINFNNAAGSYPGQIGYSSNHNLTFVTGSLERMRITADGRIGISTISPDASIEVEDDHAALYLTTTTGMYGSSIHLTNNNPYGTSLGDIQFRNTETEYGGFFYDSNHKLEIVTLNNVRLVIDNVGQVGINRIPTTNYLEVGGNASKYTAGDWLANSDARLKKNIQPLESKVMLEKLLKLQGVIYEWNDDKTGNDRPEGIQYGFTAQNIQEAFPTLVEEDNLGYLQTAYGTYDPMMVEAIRALNDKIQILETENAVLKSESEVIKADIAEIKKVLNTLMTDPVANNK